MVLSAKIRSATDAQRHGVNKRYRLGYRCLYAKQDYLNPAPASVANA